MAELRNADLSVYPISVEEEGVVRVSFVLAKDWKDVGAVCEDLSAHVISIGLPSPLLAVSQNALWGIALDAEALWRKVNSVVNSDPEAVEDETRG